MNYNMNFLIAAFVLLLLVWYHSINSRRLLDRNVRIFSVFLVLGILDILFDIITTVLISDGEPDFTGMTLFLLTVFYILQVLVPYSLFLYTWSLCEQTKKAEKIVYGIMAVPVLLMGGVVLLNVKSGLLFQIDAAGTYIKGPYYLSMYQYAFAYGVAILLCSIWRYGKLGVRKLGIILEFLFILGSCVGIQALRNDLLMTGFGLGLGILVLYLTINNPSDYTDTLTGMLNGRSFQGRIRQMYERRKGFHILTVELSQMKKINLLFGTGFGDRLLGKIAGEMEKIPEVQYSFRISGKRFAMVMTSLYDYERVRSKITEFLKEPLKVQGEGVIISSVVCGIINADELKEYDTLWSYIVYLSSLAPPSQGMTLIQSDENTRKGFLEKREIEGYLITAITEDLFEIYYQPVYSLQDGEYVTVEALSRLRHPTLGVISPDVFISLAEKNGQIVQIGELQFRRVCSYVKAHPELLDRLENIKFNLSPAELLRDGCSKRILRTIREFDLPYTFFQFEITETAATQCGSGLYRVMEDFQACGIKLSMDDFGSGYANLDMVLKLSFSSVKLDRSLLNGIMEDEKARVFYRSMVEVLQNMGYSVISEGVESVEEVELLRSWGVDMIQGYYFSRPLSSEKLLEKLFRGQSA